MKAAPQAGLEMKLRSLKLPSFVAHHGEVAGRAETGGWPFDRFLDTLAELELEERTRRRIERVLKGRASAGGQDAGDAGPRAAAPSGEAPGADLM